MSARSKESLGANLSLAKEAQFQGADVAGESVPDMGEQVAATRAEGWRIENISAMRSSNDYVERMGLPLSRFRQF